MLGKGLVRVRGRSVDGQMMVRGSGEVQVNVSGMSGECQISLTKYLNSSVFLPTSVNHTLDLMCLLKQI